MSEITKHPENKAHFMWLLFALLSIFVYFFGLTIPLVGPDEPRYAQVAREMFERGDWITPTLGGFNWFEKPPLLYWLQIISYNLFGVSEFAARFGSAIFGLGTVFSLWVLGRFSSTEITKKESQTRSKTSASSVANNFANLLALIAGSTIGIIVFSRGASFDIILTFPITAALVSFFIFDRNENAGDKRSPVATAPGSDKSGRLSAIFLFAFYFFIGLALLAKGLIGIVFPFAIVGFYYLISRRFPDKNFLVSLVWGTAVSILVASAWYLPMYLRHGWIFIDEFFIQHHFQRFTSNKYLHPQPFYFFLWVLPLMTIPWTPFFVAAIWKTVKGFFYRRDAETQKDVQPPAAIGFGTYDVSPPSPSPLLLFSLSWLLVPLVFFSFSGSKLPGYILPAVPAAIILTGLYVSRFTAKNILRKWLIQLTALATYAVVVIGVIFFADAFADGDSVKGLLAEADKRGFSESTVLTLHTISHNAEFYAAGRLIRTQDGKQKKQLGPREVLEEIQRNDNKPALVLVPLEYLQQLLDYPQLESEVLRDNGEHAIVYCQNRLR